MVTEKDEKEKDVATSAEHFVQRMRHKMASPMHQFKKTDRINIQVRYPQYTEEKKEEVPGPPPPPKVSLEAVVKKGYDEEILSKLRNFLEFIKRIFKDKGNQETEEDHEQG